MAELMRTTGDAAHATWRKRPPRGGSRRRMRVTRSNAHRRSPTSCRYWEQHNLWKVGYATALDGRRRYGSRIPDARRLGGK
jgi:hypothetical protein